MHVCPEALRRNVYLALVGVGGTGSQILSGLARLHLSMLALGHPRGLTVEAYDPDVVSEANVGRQLFYRDDVGRNKAEVLVNRINMAYGLNWIAKGEEFKHSRYMLYESIVISCVDSRKARASIRKDIEAGAMGDYPTYVLDCGNGNDYGQVILGCFNDARLPLPWQDRPALYDASIPEDDTPSCSLAGALRNQELYINQQVATCALQLLWELFRHGGLDKRGFVINQKSGKILPLALKAEEAKGPAKKKKAKTRGS
jgi:PRTRC genetic system ThiF family protein